MSDAVKIEERIIECIRAGHNRFQAIRTQFDENFRVIDKRLQSLRKRGLIKFSQPKGWTLK